MKNKIKKIYLDYVNLIVDKLRTGLKDKLVSVVLYGSVARGEAGEGSDIDLLMITREFEGGRFDVFNTIEKELRASDVYRNLKENNLGTLISPVPLTSFEIRKNPSILLDIVTDGIVLYDTEDFIKNKIEDLKKRLEAIGSKKVFLGDGKYYWDLKPDYKFGEVVEL